MSAALQTFIAGFSGWQEEAVQLHCFDTDFLGPKADFPPSARDMLYSTNPTSMDDPKEEINESSTDSYVANPNLSAALKADYLALQNDLQQARELAADFQRQLSGQTNEHAVLKQILAKTQNDLAKLQTSIMDLREERHRLANHAFEAIALREKLKRSEQENAKLQKELEQLRARNIPQKAEASASRGRSWWQIKK